MITAIRYMQSRYFCKRRGWGRVWFRPIWLEAIVYGIVRYYRLKSRRFNRWCDQVDLLFVAQHDWPRAYTLDTGRDCWIDGYAEGMSPQDAVDNEVQHWDSYDCFCTLA